MKRNILLTTLGNTFNYTRHHYYNYEGKEQITYCEGISNAEAGAKYILSKVPIDKIIVLGPSSLFNDENIDYEVELRDFGEYGAMDPSKYSEYKYFCYRIMQFLNRVDIEGDDLLKEISDEERKILLEKVREFGSRKNLQYEEKRKFDQLFHLMNQDQSLFNEFCSELEDPEGELKKWLKHYLFMVLNGRHKMTSLDANDDITVQFVPTILKGQSSLRMGNLPEILDQIMGSGRSEVSLFVDLQGMDIADSHTLINVLFMLQNERAKMIHIEEIITTTYRRSLFTSPIEDQKTRLELSELLSGMDAFLQYGKVDSMRRYWLSRNIKDEHIDRLIYAMQTVDVGITLCSVSDIERGIGMLQKVFNDDEKSPSNAIEGMIFGILERGIKYDYGKLLRGDDVDILALVKWAVKKQFYQQAITIIESRVPYDMVKNGIFYYARNEEDKQEFLARLNEQYWRAQTKDRYQFDDLNHYFVKYFRRREAYKNKSEQPMATYVKIRMDEVFEPNSEHVAYTLFNGKRALMEEFMLRYIEIGNIRNLISHAQEVDIDYEWSLEQENEKIRILREYITSFLEIYERIRTGINRKDNNSVMLTHEEFYEYRNAHMLRWDELKGKK